MRELFKKMNVQNAKRRFPSPLLAIDETLYPSRGAIGFKQYNPNKRVKYGLLYRSLCDSSTSCTYFTLPYAGKPEEIAGEAAKFYVTGTDEYTTSIYSQSSTNTTVSKVAAYPWIGNSPQSHWQNGNSKIILPSLVPCGTTERISQMN